MSLPPSHRPEETSEQQWQAARKELPWVPVEKEYRFATEDGPKSRSPQDRVVTSPIPEVLQDDERGRNPSFLVCVPCAVYAPNSRAGSRFRRIRAVAERDPLALCSGREPRTLHATLPLARPKSSRGGPQAVARAQAKVCQAGIATVACKPTLQLRSHLQRTPLAVWRDLRVAQIAGGLSSCLPTPFAGDLESNLERLLDDVRVRGRASPHATARVAWSPTGRARSRCIRMSEAHGHVLRAPRRRGAPRILDPTTRRADPKSSPAGLPVVQPARRRVHRTSLDVADSGSTPVRRTPASTCP
jgi:hypothetical protein